MTQHTTSQPGALCAAYARLLPLVNTGGLAPDETLAVREHVNRCGWCRTRLAEYDALYSELRSRFGPIAAPAEAPSARQIAYLSRSSPGATPLRSATSLSSGAHPAILRVPLRAELVAALLVVAMLGLLLGWVRQTRSGGQPPLDPQAQAYVATLHADYPRVLDALGVDTRQCIYVFTSAPQADKLADMVACRTVEAAVVSASQTLLADLTKSPPPPRWQAADGQLKAWARALIKAFTDRITAIDAHDVTRFAALANSEVAPATNLSCAPIGQINAALPATSQLPASASGACS